MVKGKNIICPQCGSRFKTANALAQHRSTVHSVSGSARRNPVRRVVRPKRTGSSMSMQTLSGSDRLSYVSLSAGQGPGTSFTRMPLGPQVMDGSRLQAHAKLWARWRPTKLGVRVVLAGATTTFGSITAGWSPEVDFPTSSPIDTLVTRIQSLKPSVTTRPYESVTFQIPCETSRKWYHTVGTLDEAAHGSIVMTVASALGGFSGVMGATIILDWTIQFEGIELTPTASGDSIDYVKPDAGWSHLFTTSDGSWDASRLTFKMTSGGAMCPFSAAKENHIYEPSTGVKVTYKNETGADVDAKYFVVIQGYTTPGFALCASATDAKAYIQTGDINKLLPYHSAGSWVTPDIPTFKGKAASTYSEDLKPDYDREIERLQGLVSSLQRQLHLVQEFEVVPSSSENC